MFDINQINFIDGASKKQSSAHADYYDWKKYFDWQSCGIKDFHYQPMQYCGGFYSSYCYRPVYVRPCRYSCQKECVPDSKMVCNETEHVVNETEPVVNVTIPELPPPAGEEVPSEPEPEPVIITNCSYFKVCRKRPKCNVDKSWWDYWGVQEKGYGYSSGGCGCQPCCATCACKPKKMRKRVCNATMDDTFDP